MRGKLFGQAVSLYIVIKVGRRRVGFWVVFLDCFCIHTGLVELVGFFKFSSSSGKGNLCKRISFCNRE